jgi:hypothetical protein
MADCGSLDYSATAEKRGKCRIVQTYCAECAISDTTKTECRRQLDRLLDPGNKSVTLANLRRAASAVGRRLRVGLE